MAIDHSSPPASAAASPPQHAAPRKRHFSPASVIGEVLIAMGVVVGLFLLWQLFYTDVRADREQQQILDELEFSSPITANGGGADGDITLPDVMNLIPDELQFTDDPPVMSTQSHATTFGALYVPRWGDDYAKPISEGISRADVLDVLGIGHYPETAMPGGWGNFAIAGHRTTYGSAFADVDQLVIGDSIIVQTDEAWYVYTVTQWRIVAPQDVEVIAPIPGEADSSANGRYITLTTCHPRYSDAQRWIVHGELEYWAPTGNGYPPEMVEDLS